MPVHGRQKVPEGHGEVLCSPPFEEWEALARANSVMLGALPEALGALRAQARLEAGEAGRSYSRSIGVTPAPAPRSDLIVMTGHQPDFYHPGVWVKDFLVQRFADATGALGIDLVVDTDAAGDLELRTPCFEPEVRVCGIPLCDVDPGRAYVQVASPSEEQRSVFREAVLSALSTLPAPALSRHFATFCDGLDAAAQTAGDVATLMTAARRVYERPAATDYLELPVSVQARSRAFRRFASSLLLDAERFREVYNAELASYRLRTGTRSAAQPVPDLGRVDDRVECALWLLDDQGRSSVSVDARNRLYARDRVVADLGDTVDAAVAALEHEGLLLAPKALALTLFQRLFVADLFVHGTGGARYDRVTDGIIGAYYGCSAPAYAVASMTLLLPLGARVTSDEEVTTIEQRLSRLEHNPDEFLGEVEFDTPGEHDEAERLVREKAALVAAIESPGVDRKALGARIRRANTELAALLEPFVLETRAELRRLRAARDSTEVLQDRSYPFCLYDPREVMDKVR